MKKSIILMLTLVGAPALVSNTLADTPNPAVHNIVWDTTGVDSRDSMPLGNGDIGLNVWTEPNGDVVFYISKTDAWAHPIEKEMGLLKVGRVRLKLKPDVQLVHQTLQLRDGAVEIQAGARMTRLWVDANHPVVRVETSGTKPFTMQAVLEPMRPVADQGLPADTILEEQKDRVAWFFRNGDGAVPQLKHLTFGAILSGSGMTKLDRTTLHTKEPVLKAEISIHPLTTQSNTSEEWLAAAEQSASTAGDGDWAAHREWWRKFWDRSWICTNRAAKASLIPPNPHPLRSGEDQSGGNRFSGEIRNVQIPKDLTGSLALEAEVKPAPDGTGRIFDKLTPGQPNGFLLDLQPGNNLRLIVGSAQQTAKDVLPANEWSKVQVKVDAKGWQVLVNGKSVLSLPSQPGATDLGHMYALQRFVSACAGRGTYPIKFNGSIFTMDWHRQVKVDGVETTRVMSADARIWGGQYWFQNTRAMYWPMLQSGDFEMMLPLFRMYQGQLENNARLVRDYYGHDGAYFAETKPFWGGLDKVGPNDAPYFTKHYYTPILELSAMMLDYFAYTGDEKFAAQSLLPVAQAGLTFYDQHFKRANGKLVIEPANAVETYWKVRNPTPDLAGLRWVLRGMLALPENLTTPDQRARWQSLASALPELPVGNKNGTKVLLPAEAFDQPRNAENPELYAIYPFRLFGLGKDQLDLARTSFSNRRVKNNFCWHQDGIQAALVGDVEAAYRNVIAVLSRKEPQCRFPVFWEMGYDYVPDQDNGGNGLNALQLMLLQAEGDAIRLLPAWPKDQDVHFKLHAPRNTTVECVYQAGEIRKLVVTPASRSQDVIHP
jgi:hypothetical protein